MEILKKGKIDRLINPNQEYKGKCYNCKCVFIYKEAEIDCGNEINEIPSVKCPDCGVPNHYLWNQKYKRRSKI